MPKVDEAQGQRAGHQFRCISVRQQAVAEVHRYRFDVGLTRDPGRRSRSRSHTFARRVCLLGKCQYSALTCSPSRSAMARIERFGSPWSSRSWSAAATTSAFECRWTGPIELDAFMLLLYRTLFR